MCNAQNHPPECTCGWGGPGNLGGGPRGQASLVAATQVHSSFGWHRISYRELVSYMRPNAKCPVCGQEVYFYESSTGGRVFFDDLGPPWPKHPCTDSGNARPNLRTIIRAIPQIPTPPNGDRILAIPHPFEWKPFLISRLEVHREAGYSKIRAVANEKEIEIFVTECNLMEDAPFFFRETSATTYAIATIHVNYSGLVHSLIISGFTGLLDLSEQLKNARRAHGPRHISSKVIKRKVTIKANGPNIYGPRMLKKHVISDKAGSEKRSITVKMVKPILENVALPEPAAKEKKKTVIKLAFEMAAHKVKVH